ncbi:MAG TPA: CPBP family intramembrane glutamic endopeptidase [Clostridia bacterium]|nr:CPBP family intramembrane glutamic endopeptidase [Clostridia bacterium]
MGTGKYLVKTYIRAISEVIAAFFVLLFLFKIFEVLPTGEWENKTVKFRLTGYLVMLLLPVFMILLDRSGFIKYGITLKNSSLDVDTALSCFIPSLAIAAALHLTNWRNWGGALIVAAIEAAVMVIVIYIINKNSNINRNSNRTKNLVLLSCIIIVGGLLQALFGRMISDIVSSFVRFFIIVAPAEEFFFRGYVQTKLNDVFEKNFHLPGVNFGWGLIVSSLLFGVMHVFNSYNPFLCSYDISLPWGIWTIILGFILGLIREKTNSLTAPVILHAVINFF